VTGGGTGVVPHAGLVLLRQLADRTGLPTGLSQALPTPDGGLDRGRVFAGLACAIADGARVISDFRVMGDQGEVLGQVASVPAAWRTLREIAAGGDRTRRCAQLTLFEAEDGWRYTLRAANLPGDTRGWRGQCAYIDAAHRVHARVEDVIRTGKATGLGHFPYVD
jgi:hypothetical protein